MLSRMRSADSGPSDSPTPPSLSAATSRVPPRRHPLQPCGSSLLEVLVALTFIAVFAAGFAGVAISVMGGNARARSTDIAVFLAHDRLELIRNTAYGSITAANFPAEGYGTIAVGSPAVSFPDFRRTTTIQNDTPTAGLRRVVVTVAWRGGSLSEEMLVSQ